MCIGDEVISAPIVRGVIEDGEAVVSDIDTKEKCDRIVEQIYGDQKNNPNGIGK